jgi:hypothetical protein
MGGKGRDGISHHETLRRFPQAQLAHTFSPRSIRMLCLSDSVLERVERGEGKSDPPHQQLNSLWSAGSAIICTHPWRERVVGIIPLAPKEGKGGRAIRQIFMQRGLNLFGRFGVCAMLITSGNCIAPAPSLSRFVTWHSGQPEYASFLDLMCFAENVLLPKPCLLPQIPLPIWMGVVGHAQNFLIPHRDCVSGWARLISVPSHTPG